MQNEPHAERFIKVQTQAKSQKKRAQSAGALRNQPSNLPANQPTSQPANQPTSQPTQPAGEPAIQPANQPSSQPAYVASPADPASRPTKQPPTHPAYQPPAGEGYCFSFHTLAKNRGVTLCGIVRRKLLETMVFYCGSRACVNHWEFNPNVTHADFVVVSLQGCAPYHDMCGFLFPFLCF
jgi:hypothetical protein